MGSRVRLNVEVNMRQPKRIRNVLYELNTDIARPYLWWTGPCLQQMQRPRIDAGSWRHVSKSAASQPIQRPLLLTCSLRLAASSTRQLRTTTLNPGDLPRLCARGSSRHRRLSTIAKRSNRSSLGRFVWTFRFWGLQILGRPADPKILIRGSTKVSPVCDFTA